MKLKPLTKKQKEADIASLKKLADTYKKEAAKPGRRKRHIVPFELDMGNFCCAKLHENFIEGKHEFNIFCAGGKYIVHLTLRDSCANYCPYCKKHINEFFYIKQY